ncbi:MAG: HPF/RaiA family ribosome-associated protein [Bacteroidota bacterium]
MKILFNKDKNDSQQDDLKTPSVSLLLDKLKRFNNLIIQLDVHLSDVTGKKKGNNDKQCVLETYLEGKPPVIVTNQANTFEEALKDAIRKLVSSLNSTNELSRNYKQDFDLRKKHGIII